MNIQLITHVGTEQSRTPPVPMPDRIMAPVADSAVAANKSQSVDQNARKDSEKKKDVSESQLNESVKNLNDYMQQSHRALQFVLDKDSGMTIIKVLDSETNKVIRQIPSEEVVEMSKQLAKGAGMIVKEQV